MDGEQIRADAFEEAAKVADSEAQACGYDDSEAGDYWIASCIARKIRRQARIEQAIADFNSQGKTEEVYGSTSRVYARRPILATDCDYEIVRVSGVQGVKLPAERSKESPSHD